MSTASPPPVDAKTFWRTLGQRAIGVTLVTARGADGPAGLLALSATHMCADPPTMIVSIDKRTSALAAVETSGHFAVNFLPAGAEDEAKAFAGRTDQSGSARFAPGRWDTLATGAPTHVDALGVFDCRVEESLERHGTMVFFGRVVATRVREDLEPLVFFRGGYR